MERHWHEAHPSEEETAKQRLDRNFAELLQELRVTQTGVQILLGFLLTMVFASGFTKVDGWELGLYGVAVCLTTLAMALLLAPVALHRVLFRRGMKRHLVRLTHILTFWAWWSSCWPCRPQPRWRSWWRWAPPRA